jgi:acetyltransferase-like isoleucine patch superfamily enzyme
MINNAAQNIILKNGHRFIENDWSIAALPDNLELGEMSYPDTSYSYTGCFSKKKVGFHLGYASGNYGHGIFITGENGEIIIQKFVVLQSTRIIAELSVTIKDHCMCSWGSVITDNWIHDKTLNSKVRRKILYNAANSGNRNVETGEANSVIIEENVWIGFGAIILPGVTIGRGAIVGCKTLVNENVPPYAVIVGNPGKIIKLLEPNDTDEIKKEAIREFTGRTA